MATVLADHIIKLDSVMAKELGFTSDRFGGWLWRKGNTIIISFIVSRHEEQDHLGALFDAIWHRGWTVQVPTPMGRMPAILARKGFKKRYVYDEQYGEDVEVWER